MKKQLLYWLASLLIVSACQKEINVDAVTEDLPKVETGSTQAINDTTYRVSGTVASEGSSAVIARGICWDTLPNPDLTDEHSINGSGLGLFADTLAPLLPGKTYHVRAYATNNAGTAYGADSSFTTPNPFTIYVAGFDANNATEHALLWKNGVVSSYGTDLARATAVVVAPNNDVYLGGSEVSTGPAGYVRYAKYWKNGVETMLGTDFSEVNALALAGNDLYAVGYESVGTANAAAVWKNGVVTHLSDGVNNAVINSIFIQGSDVYLVGSDGYNWKLWKNGVATTLTGIDNASAVFVSGTDVYVAGYAITAGAQDRAVLWKNGVVTDLTDGSFYAQAKSVFVDGSDVYVTGVEADGPALHSLVAKLWKNGTEIILPGDDAEGSAVTVFRGDVYVAGTSNLTGPNQAMLWKNGTPTLLPSSPLMASANALYIR